jgi:uncharacterized membrane protein
MTLDALIMLVGALVAILPFLGFPNSWDTIFFVILGVLVIALGIIVRRRPGTHGLHQSTPSKTFVEHEPMNDHADIV